MFTSTKNVFRCFSFFGIFPFSFRPGSTLHVNVSKSLSVVPIFSILLVTLNYMSIVNSAVNGSELIKSFSNFIYNSSVFVAVFTSLRGKKKTEILFNCLFSCEKSALKKNHYLIYYIIMSQLILHRTVEIIVCIVMTDPSFDEVLSIFLYVLPFTHLLFFSLVIHEFEIHYQSLNESLKLIFEIGNVSSFKLKSIRFKHFNLVELLRTAVDRYGVSNFSIISGVVIHLIETVHQMVNKLERGVDKELVHFVRLVTSGIEGVMLVVYITVRTNFLNSQNEMLAKTLLKTSITNIDTNTLSQMTELIDDVTEHKIKVTAYECFALDASLIFSIFGILTSYILVVAPLDTIKNKD